MVYTANYVDCIRTTTSLQEPEKSFGLAWDSINKKSCHPGRFSRFRWGVDPTHSCNLHSKKAQKIVFATKNAWLFEVISRRCGWIIYNKPMKFQDPYGTNTLRMTHGIPQNGCFFLLDPHGSLKVLEKEDVILFFHPNLDPRVRLLKGVWEEK